MNNECVRCKMRTSVFWYAWRFCDEIYYLCDRCQADLSEWIKEGRE